MILNICKGSHSTGKRRLHLTLHRLHFEHILIMPRDCAWAKWSFLVLTHVLFLLHLISNFSKLICYLRSFFCMSELTKYYQFWFCFLDKEKKRWICIAMIKNEHIVGASYVHKRKYISILNASVSPVKIENACFHNQVIIQDTKL